MACPGENGMRVTCLVFNGTYSKAGVSTLGRGEGQVPVTMEWDPRILFAEGGVAVLAGA